MSGTSDGKPLPEVNGNPVNLEDLDSWVQLIHTVHQTQVSPTILAQYLIKMNQIPNQSSGCF